MGDTDRVVVVSEQADNATCYVRYPAVLKQGAADADCQYRAEMGEQQLEEQRTMGTVVTRRK